MVCARGPAGRAQELMNGRRPMRDVLGIDADHSTLADHLLPVHRTSRRLMDCLLVFTFSLAIAAFAQVRIPLPFTPVPITGLTLGVLLTGAALGGVRGAAATGLYVAWGGLGLPVFANGTSGVAEILGPTGGYLLACPIAAFHVGCLSEQDWDRRVASAHAAMLVGTALILLVGSLWLSLYVGGLRNALVEGVLPFLPGDIVKVIVAGWLLPGAWRLADRR